eukprot:CAMPEP_0183819754 /NCGR_PEP_ID=MMETSP0803_2-20130417/64299_1 /TAXON_ID=195967 /ORGANISM="Crustomastix stigmata, Strain CCMP3273" /LENGTH=463 /DNA_ID=CAMNT_0026064643 /DNA_START=725 /DNA_END=2116 /DNA_ORIENTATION=-
MKVGDYMLMLERSPDYQTLYDALGVNEVDDIFKIQAQIKNRYDARKDKQPTRVAAAAEVEPEAEKAANSELQRKIQSLTDQLAAVKKNNRPPPPPAYYKGGKCFICGEPHHVNSCQFLPGAQEYAQRQLAKDKTPDKAAAAVPGIAAAAMPAEEGDTAYDYCCLALTAPGGSVAVSKQVCVAHKPPDEELLFDSGATIFCFNRKEFFSTLDLTQHPSTLGISSQGAEDADGVGTVCISMRDTDGVLATLRLTDCRYHPNQPFNVISEPLMYEKGWTFSSETNLLKAPDKRTFRLCRIGKALHFDDAKIITSADKGNKAEFCAAVTTHPRSDWQLSKTHFSEIMEKHCPDSTLKKIELFRTENNKLLEHGYTEEDDAFTKLWIKALFYGNGVYNIPFLLRMLKKALHDFNLSPMDTVFIFVVPYWDELFKKDGELKTLVNQFQVAHIYRSRGITTPESMLQTGN